MKHIVMIGLLIILSSCGGAKYTASKIDRFVAKKIAPKDTAAIDSIRLQEAKMVDIPIPLSAEPLPEYFDPANSAIILGYEDKILLPSAIEEFYLKEMERLGWQAKEQFIGYESKLRFTKPQRSCLISVRFDEAKQCTQFAIFTGAKAITAA